MNSDENVLVDAAYYTTGVWGGMKKKEKIYRFAIAV